MTTKTLTYIPTYIAEAIAAGKEITPEMQHEVARCIETAPYPPPEYLEVKEQSDE